MWPDSVKCPYDRVAYKDVPGYVMGYGCPVCGGIGPAHTELGEYDRKRIVAHIELMGDDSVVGGYLQMVVGRLDQERAERDGIPTAPSATTSPTSMARR